MAIARQEADRALKGRLCRTSAPPTAPRPLDEGDDLLEQALAISRGLRNRARESIVLNILGLTYASLGQYTHAIASLSRPWPWTRQRSNQAKMFVGDGLSCPRVAMTRQRHNPAQEARPLMNLGSVYNRLGQDEHARVSLEQALAVMREVHDWRGEMWSLTLLGWVYHGLGQDEHARVSSSRPSRFNVRLVTGAGSAPLLHRRGQVYAVSQYDRARADYEQALMAAREKGIGTAKGRSSARFMAVWHAHTGRAWRSSTANRRSTCFRRSGSSGLAAELQEGFLASKEPVYRSWPSRYRRKGGCWRPSRCSICSRRKNTGLCPPRCRSCRGPARAERLDPEEAVGPALCRDCRPGGGPRGRAGTLRLACPHRGRGGAAGGARSRPHGRQLDLSAVPRGRAGVA